MTDPRSGSDEPLAGRYLLDRELGRGGMAVVFLARDLRHDRPVAVKVLHPDFADAVGSARFQREIQTTARLMHPHILPLYDSGETEGLLWYVMPFVEGESVRDRLDRCGWLPVEEALRVAREVAEALDYAHRQGVVHRDIKPENILLHDVGALLVDFGLARLAGVATAAGGGLTRAGFVMGTPSYMSPEQAQAGSLDGRSDIYSLGCVLYEMLAGVPAFAAPTPRATIEKHFAGPPPRVRLLRPEVPERVERALARALAHASADRFATAGDLARALASGGPDVAPHEPVERPRRRSAPQWLAATLREVPGLRRLVDPSA